MDSGIEAGRGRTESPGVGREATELAKEKASAAWDDTKATARAKLNEQKDDAADGIEQVAGALRDASRRGDADGDGLARLTGSAADALERFSGTLRSKDVGSMLHDVERFAREQPVAFFGVALAAGFLGARFMKAGRTRKET